LQEGLGVGLFIGRISVCQWGAGGTSVYASHPLNRRFRDAHVATQHVMVAPPTLEVAGRVLLGLPVDASML
jgi:indole-3-acetate monooxygenase